MPIIINRLLICASKYCWILAFSYRLHFHLWHVAPFTSFGCYTSYVLHWKVIVSKLISRMHFMPLQTVQKFQFILIVAARPLLKVDTGIISPRVPSSQLAVRDPMILQAAGWWGKPRL